MIALIAAYDRNRLIGAGGRIPWKIPGEQLRFRELTMGKTVIMGRRTFEEIGRPLPGRQIITVSASRSFDMEGVRTAASLKEAIRFAGEGDVFLAGGERIYREGLPLAQKLFITEIDAEFEGDVWFPAFDESAYTKRVEKHSEGRIPYTYVTYEKISLPAQ